MIVPETEARPLDEDDPYDAIDTLPAQLHRKGILFAFATFDSPVVRNLPYQAAASVPFGLERGCVESGDNQRGEDMRRGRQDRVGGEGRVGGSTKLSDKYSARPE